MLRIFALIFLFAGAARADITHKLQSSVQLTVDGAASQATRIGSTYSVSGSNISVAGALQISSGGLAGSLAGTIATDGAMTITAGGAGTTATGQHVSEVTVR